MSKRTGGRKLGITGGWRSDSNSFAGEYGSICVLDSPAEDSLEAEGDHAGSWPLFYARSSGVCVVTNDAHAAALVTDKRNISQVVAVETLLLGHALGRETTIDGVSRLWPGERLRISSSGTFSIADIHKARTAYSARKSTVREHAHRTFEDLVGAVADMPPLDSSSAIQLSGGLDSRLTVGALRGAGVTAARAVTLGIADDHEAVVAREVAERLGYSHSVLQVDTMRPSDLRDGWALTGGQVSPIAAAGNLPIYHSMRRRADEPVTVWGAWPGDCLAGSYVPPARGVVDPTRQTQMVRKWARVRLQNALATARAISVTGQSSHSLVGNAVNRLTAAVDCTVGPTAAHAISHWAMYRRQPAFSYISPARLSRDVLEVTPVLSPAYLSDLLSLSGPEIYDKNFYRYMIYEALPDLRPVIYHNTGRPITPTRSSPSRFPRGPQEARWWLPAAMTAPVTRLKNRSSRITDTLEQSHWRAVLPWDGTVEIASADLRLDLSAIAHPQLRLHASAMSLALTWTEQYLSRA